MLVIVFEYLGSTDKLEKSTIMILMNHFCNVFKIFPKSYCVYYFWDLVIIFGLFIFFLLQNFEELFIKEIHLQ